MTAPNSSSALLRKHWEGPPIFSVAETRVDGAGRSDDRTPSSLRRPEGLTVARCGQTSAEQRPSGWVIPADRATPSSDALHDRGRKVTPFEEMWRRRKTYSEKRTHRDPTSKTPKDRRPE
ncbi:hypothetical protein AAFF_G00182310 [Aldrovandia affinis]|uniref:Uncharacterized protein n=1 Tax=Aldrovandia affinis TaxID=143900 RepID=A0AAD7RKG7_9TELE|nr:hypothetical protein AAFF_G00182310 [Aldrovandia affinis]